MYINEAIRRAKAYCPSEYTDEEMYSWCDEVSAMLAVEDRIIYKEIRPPIAADGSVLLPEGVRLENISHVYAGLKEIPRRSMREAGRRLISDIPINDDVIIVYEQPYFPIRRTEYSGVITIDGDVFTIPKCEFIVGDTVDIKIGDDTATVHILAVDYDTEDITLYNITVGGDELDSLTTGTGTIKRVVTDKTVCDAPYDSMYIDYILGKVAEYQKDRSTYNNKINNFNTKLGQYKEWLTSRMPTEKIKLKNIW